MLLTDKDGMEYGKNLLPNSLITIVIVVFLVIIMFEEIQLIRI